MLRCCARLRKCIPIRQQRLKPRRGRIESPSYLRWIRSLQCMIQSQDCRGGTEPHRVGRFGQGRANDYNAVPLCRRHHDLTHQIRRVEFETRFDVNFEAAIARLNEEYANRRVASTNGGLQR